jgi:hypothetical protein
MSLSFYKNGKQLLFIQLYCYLSQEDKEEHYCKADEVYQLCVSLNNKVRPTVNVLHKGKETSFVVTDLTPTDMSSSLSTNPI